MVQQLAGGMEATGELDQLLQIVEAAFGRLSLAVAQHGAIAGRVEQQRQLVGERMLGVAADAADCIGESQAGGASLGRQRRGFQGGHQRHLPPGGLRFQHLHRLGSETASGRVDDAPERLVALTIVRGGRQAQQRERILDFGALINRSLCKCPIADTLITAAFDPEPVVELHDLPLHSGHL